jgi:hypothetical protein
MACQQPGTQAPVPFRAHASLHEVRLRLAGEQATRAPASGYAARPSRKTQREPAEQGRTTVKPEPAAAIAAAGAAAEALSSLAGTGIPADLPLGGHARVLGLLQDTARHLCDSLHTEGALTEAALMLRLGAASDTVLISDADHARDALITAAHRTDSAADRIREAWQEVTACGQSETGPMANPLAAVLMRRAREASDRAADLAGALAAAEQQAGDVPAVALITGHRQITQALYASTASLGQVCRWLQNPLLYTMGELGPEGSARTTGVTGPLGEAAGLLREARPCITVARVTLTRRRAAAIGPQPAADPRGPRGRTSRPEHAAAELGT